MADTIESAKKQYNGTPKELPDADLLNELLHYDKYTGMLSWKVRELKHFNHVTNKEAVCKGWNKRLAGTQAFTTKSKGNKGMVFGKPYSAHRLIWKMFYGEDP